MEKEIHMLNESLKYSKSRDIVTFEFNKLKSPYFKVGIVTGIIIFVLLNGIFTFISGDNDSFIFALIITLALNRMQIFYRTKKNSEKLNELTNKYNELTRLISETGLHPQYSYTYAIEKLLNYLNVGRAESFKEALNLLETDLRHDQQLQKLQEVYNEQRKQTEELKNIKYFSKF